MSEDRIQQAIDAGQKNLQTMKLIRNWCANAKVVKHGGTGLVEMQTGLPIGHHFIECPHAPAGGMAAWDLADTAIDFYDRNCADCKVRKPVGMPNISGLVAERDKKRKRGKLSRPTMPRQRPTVSRLASSSGALSDRV
jgi:hypothetical protein